MVRVPVPSSALLREVAATLFYLYDVNNTKTLELKEYSLLLLAELIRIATWMETCKDFSAFLAKYEPKTKILEKKSIFSGFPAIQIDAFSTKILRTHQISSTSNNDSIIDNA